MEDNFCDFLFAFLHVKHILPISGEGFTLKGKNLLPNAANSFFLEQTPFQKALIIMVIALKLLFVSGVQNCLLLSVNLLMCNPFWHSQKARFVISIILLKF